jgi:hypothetical protein
MYDSADLEINNFLPDISFGTTKKPFESNEEDLTSTCYFYKHSRINNEMCFSDSSKYITSLMRLPWQLNLSDKKFDGQTLCVMTHVSFDPNAWAIRLKSGKHFIFQELIKRISSISKGQINKR